MASTNKPVTLYFIAPIYARGEHLIGEKAVDDDGHPNMIRVARGEKRRVPFEMARDLIIAKQAIDWDNAKPAERAEAEASVADRNRVEADMLKKHAEAKESDADLKTQLAQLRREIEQLKKKAA